MGLFTVQLFEIPLYLHVVRGYNGTDTGLILLPSTISGSAASLYAGWHMKRWASYKTLTVVSSIFPILAAISLITTWGLNVSVLRMATECALASWGGGYVPVELVISHMWADSSRRNR